MRMRRAGGTPPAAREQVPQQNDPIRPTRRHGNHLLMKPYYGLFLLILGAFIEQKQFFRNQEGALTRLTNVGWKFKLKALIHGWL